jgi:ATP-dependent Clp protease protease subunit
LFAQREGTRCARRPSAELRAALAVYDVIRALRAGVRTICLGVAAGGGAALVLAGGADGQRAALPNARMTFCDPRRDLTGTSGELDVQMRELLRLRQQVHELLARHTRQPLERIHRDAEREQWLSAEQARTYGLIDEILQPGRAGQDPDRPRS